jgi:hypothetical protein
MGFGVRSLGARLEAVWKIDVVVPLNLIDPLLLQLNGFHGPGQFLRSPRFEL